ncbi:hypothetical protein [Streptococcus zalophi]|uniref:Uncharacterized protein n=1 Tax=Streptococcus zalophi TaxID=640031 RepID=A0A934P8M0_9STRE|nr:hypothetical protein [Streptococcus zalophi]MBJ8349063.1 hypothetical protein [Streptococcus zalophi]MCR8967786.1 hypothetical protein [Streptococcus zalophi]
MAIILTRKLFKFALFHFPLQLSLNGQEIGKIDEAETITIPMVSSQATLSVKAYLGKVASFNVTEGDKLVLQFNKLGKLYQLWPFLLLLLVPTFNKPIALFIDFATFAFILSPLLFPIFDIKKIEASQESNPIKIE